MLGKIMENFGCRDMCQNVLGQSDYRVFKTTISLKQNDKKFHVDISSFKLKVHWKILEWVWS